MIYEAHQKHEVYTSFMSIKRIMDEINHCGSKIDAESINYKCLEQDEAACQISFYGR